MIELVEYLWLSRADAREQWVSVIQRPDRLDKRQVDFLPIETLLCFGLGLIGTKSRSGAINIRESAPVVQALARLVKRTPASLAAKLANLDGRRANGAKNERALWAVLANDILRYQGLHAVVLLGARDAGIGEIVLPDFLNNEGTDVATVLASDRVSDSQLRESIDREFQAWQSKNGREGEAETERSMVGTARIGQQQFARSVLQNCEHACVFCGLDFRSAGLRSARMLIASHIKPWRHCEGPDRTDLRNGLSACPTHDAAFDGLLITIGANLRIEVSPSLHEAIKLFPMIERNFGPMGMAQTLKVSRAAIQPGTRFLNWHRDAAQFANRSESDANFNSRFNT